MPKQLAKKSIIIGALLFSPVGVRPQRGVLPITVTGNHYLLVEPSGSEVGWRGVSVLGSYKVCVP